MLRFFKKLLGFKRKKEHMIKSCLFILSMLFILSGCKTSTSLHTNVGNNNDGDHHNTTNTTNNSGIDLTTMKSVIKLQLKPILEKEQEQEHIIRYLEKQSIKHNTEIEKLETTIKKEDLKLLAIESIEKKEKLILNNNRISSKKKINTIKKLNNHIIINYLNHK